MCAKLKSKYLKASEGKRALEERKEEEEKKEGNASDVLSSFKERKKPRKPEFRSNGCLSKQMVFVPSLAKDKSVVRSETQSPPAGFHSSTEDTNISVGIYSYDHETASASMKDRRALTFSFLVPARIFFCDLGFPREPWLFPPVDSVLGTWTNLTLK